MTTALARERRSILADLVSSDQEVRRLGVDRLLSLPAREAIPHLTAALGDASWRVRKAAVERLVACPDDDAVLTALIDALGDGENPGRRNSAVEALIGCGARAVEPLSHRGLSSADVDVRKLVVDALAGIGAPSSARALVDTLSDRDPNVRAAVADALALIGELEATDALRRLAREETEDRLVRFSALRSLSRREVSVPASELESALGDPVLRPGALTLLGWVDGDEAIESLLKGLTGGARSAREAAMGALLRRISCVDAEDADALVTRIRHAAMSTPGLVADTIERIPDCDLSTRLLLIQFLGLVGDPDCAAAILRAARDEAVAEVAQATLEEMGDVAEQALCEAWPELAEPLRRHACVLLGRTAGPRALALLQSALDDSSGELRAAAARALGDAGCREALRTLVRRLESSAQRDAIDPDEEERAALVSALVSIAESGGGAAVDETVELLTARLEGAATEVRLLIARVLGRIGRAEDAELVVFLLKDPSANVRRAAVEALVRLEPEAGSEPLRLALVDDSPTVRIAAAAALAGSGDSRALDDLKRLIADEDDRVRAAALRAIGRSCARLADESSRAFALELIADALEGDAGVAMAAVEALGELGGGDAAVLALGLLARREPELLQAAIRCVGVHGDAGNLGELLPLVAHPEWSVRAEAIQVLAARRVPQAIPPILRRLETERDTFVRETILDALKRLEG